jgi:gas vesicle protein
MTDTQGNIDDATQAARESAERVRTAATDAGESFGASAEEIADDLSVKTEAAKNDAAGTLNDITGKVSDVIDSAKSAASDVKTAATDAARSATATIKGAADDLDIDQVIAHTRTVAGEWSEKVKEAYRERPAVVIGAAVGAVFLATAVVRAIGRR